ncbi:MAG: acyltransferase [Acetobacteraceae bacterium]
MQDLTDAGASGPGTTARLEFANQLRGLAACSVVFSHWVGVFWFMQDYLATTTLAPAQGGAVPGLVLATNFTWFQPGPFGVGLFFLISGLVVPISLEKHGAGSFLAARALRIYPTYLLGLALQVAVLLAASRIWGHPLPYDWKTILANAVLVHDLANRPSIDLVNWTLTIELRFYLLMAVLAPWIRRGRLAAVFGPAALACLAALALSQPAVPAAGTIAFLTSSQLPFLVLMLAGVLFNYHVRGKLGTAGLVAGVVAMALLMVFAWWFGVLRGQFTYVLINYAYALAVFSILYALRRQVRPNRLLGGLAAISYPLYLIHVTLGFFVLKALMLLAGIGYIPALGAALLTAIAAACLLHGLIERPSIAWGRRLAHRLVPRRVGSTGLPAPERP